MESHLAVAANDTKCLNHLMTSNDHDFAILPLDSKIAQCTCVKLQTVVS